MSTLVDWELREWATTPRFNNVGDPMYPGLTPFDEKRLQPASIDMTLSNSWAVQEKPYYNPESRSAIWAVPINLEDNLDRDVYTYRTFEADEFLLPPGHFALGATAEVVSMTGRYLGRFEGKSSLGRLGLAVHITAGYIDPGFHGTITVELYNFGCRTLMLRKGDPIGQLAVERLDQYPSKPYGEGRPSYDGQIKARPPRGHHVVS